MILSQGETPSDYFLKIALAAMRIMHERRGRSGSKKTSLEVWYWSGHSGDLELNSHWQTMANLLPL